MAGCASTCAGVPDIFDLPEHLQETSEASAQDWKRNVFAKDAFDLEVNTEDANPVKQKICLLSLQVRRRLKLRRR